MREFGAVKMNGDLVECIRDTGYNVHDIIRALLNSHIEIRAVSCQAHSVPLPQVPWFAIYFELGEHGEP